MTVALSLSAAVAFAVAAALKHTSAADLAPLGSWSPGSVWSLVRGTIAHPVWWAGSFVDVVAVGLHVLALRSGALIVVQAVLVSVLVFGLGVRWVVARHVVLREVVWSMTLSAALAGFLVLAAPTTSAGADVDRAPAVIVAASGLVIVGGCVVAARARFAHGAAAAWYGVAAGVAYAATAALLKTLTAIAAPSVTAVLAHWQLYAVVLVGAAGLLFTQLAYQAGPLAASLPCVTITNPLVSVVIGIVVFDESVRHDWSALLLMGVLLLVIGLAVYQLARSSSTAPSVDAGPGR